MLTPESPFILLDDAREGAGQPGRLYADPILVVSTRRVVEVLPKLQELRAGLATGLHAAGFLSYEAGYALDPKLAALSRDAPIGEPPLLWFALCAAPQHIRSTAIPDLLGCAGANADPPRPLIRPAAYQFAFEQVKRLIAAGDIYQANLSFPAEVALHGSPPAAYRNIRTRACAPYSALIRTGEHWLLSFSPELFFDLDNTGRVRTRPMKGTAARVIDPAVDGEAALMLARDPKQRAENLMIVDLLRNDLSRLALPGSVRVSDLFTVETYPTVHQLTSTVEARLRPGADAVDLLRTIFPCGSITGAPKLRAMEVIAQVESGPRGPYTGAIGTIAPDGSAQFNVAIRTLTLAQDGAVARLGLGSGVVADSQAQDEWQECLAKGLFIEAAARTSS